MPRLSSLSSFPLNSIVKKIPYLATVVPNVSSVNEGLTGGTVIFTVTLRNVPSGTTLYWETVSNSYYDTTPSYGQFTYSNSPVTITVTVNSDDVPEGTETVSLQVWDDTYSYVIGTSTAVTIIDFTWNTTINSGWTVGTNNLNGSTGWIAGISRDAFYDGTRYVVCGSDAFPSTNAPLIGYSTNATTWTTVNLSSLLSNNYIECGTSNGSGTSIVMTTFGAARSINGNLGTWSDISTAVDNAGLNSFQTDIIWNGTYFMATGSGGTTNFVRSTDGASWTGFSTFKTAMSQGPNNGSGEGKSIAANGATVVIVGGFGEASISTDHGATWSYVSGFSSALGTTVLGHGLAYGAYGGGGRWVYAAGSIFMNSTDGTTWTKRTAPAFWSSSGTCKVFYKNGIFMVAGNSNSYIAYSVDGGDTWKYSLASAPDNVWGITGDNADTVLVVSRSTTKPSTFVVPNRPAGNIRDAAANVDLIPPTGFSISSAVQLFGKNTLAQTSGVAGWNIVNSSYAISGPLTLEFWVYLTSMPSAAGFVGLANTSSPWSGFATVTGTSYSNDLKLFNTSPSGGNTLVGLTNYGQTPLDVQVGSWNHVAVTYTASGSQTATFWLNGAWQGSISTSNYGGEFSTFANTLRIGSYVNVTTTGFTGYYGQIRLSNTLRYTGSSSITVPTAAWTADANTIALISTT